MPASGSACDTRRKAEGAGHPQAWPPAKGEAVVTDGPEWFAPKRYGYGSGPPISWQGWAVMLGYVALIIAISIALKDQPLKLIAIVIPLTVVLMVICARTTRGGWRWRWGERD
jgi:hypothetical protein